ncbi:MAG: hypothetical protein ACSHXF_09815 [Aquaticitalea sp.]
MPATRSTSEVGIDNTIDNVQILGETLTIFGEEYDPSNPLLTAQAILAMHSQAVLAESKVDLKNNENSIDIYSRHVAFEGNEAFVTRFINQLEACGASEDIVNKARTFVNKTQGNSSKGKKKKERANKKGADNKFISDSQRSYPQLAGHFQNLVIIAEGEPLYNPSKEDLKTASMRLRLEKMVEANKNFNISDAALKMARTERKILFNTKRTGLVDTCLLAKSEVKSTYGATSPQYFMVSGLTFKRIP